MSVRLVCRLLRQLSYYLITTLNTNSETMQQLDQSAGPILAEQLQALPSLTKLRFRGDRRSCAALQKVPGCAPKVKELDLNLDWGRVGDAGADGNDDFCAVLNCVTGVTSIIWSRFPGLEDTWLPLALASCPRLVSLHLTFTIQLPDTGLRNLLNLTALQRLQFCSHVWQQLLPYVASFPSLKVIGSVPRAEPDAVERIAAITTLTRVRAVSPEDFASTPALSRLSALQVLSLCSHQHFGLDSSIAALVCVVTQLTELAISCEGRVTGLRRILDPLTRVESLHLISGSVL